MPETLVLNGVSKRYGQGPMVISSLSHVFRPGVATGLMGPNGSGKTTLLRMLSVISSPTKGEIIYGDLNIHGKPYRYLADVGIVHDEADIPSHLTAVDILEWVMRARGRWDNHSGPGRVHRFLDEVLLDERRERLIGTYSTGMIKKTQIAAAIAAEPSILLMDEPFRGLDEDATEALIRLLIGFKEKGGIVILSSHGRETLDRFCDDYLIFPIRTAEDGGSAHPESVRKSTR
jgi:ABC-2 type transport system ATP-binding protein